MEVTAETIRDQIPYYLTQEQKKGLLKALREFPRGTQYYLTGMYKDVLQGDGWTKLQVFDFQTGEKALITGIILSNTCDVAPENKRDLPVNIVFAPIIPLSAYSERLVEKKVKADSIETKIAAIKKQEVTTLFYLPAGSNLDTDHIALLDDIHTMPAKAFEREAEKGKLFTLSQIGFYLFIFKLSVHFCRIHENVNRA